MRQTSPVWQRETPKAGRPCHPAAAEAVETPGATLSRARDTPRTGVPGPNSPAEPTKGKARRLEFELGAGFEGACGFALVLALSQMTEHGLGPFGRADRHARRNPLGRQGRCAPQPGSARYRPAIT